MDPKEAIGKFEKAVEQNPDDPELWCSWGVVLMEMGDYEDAAAKFEESVNKKEDFAEAWCGWGFALMAQGRKDDAAQKIKRALEIDPNLMRDQDGPECMS